MPYKVLKKNGINENLMHFHSSPYLEQFICILEFHDLSRRLDDLLEVADQLLTICTQFALVDERVGDDEFESLVDLDV
jgi:hypothetical protein